MLNNRKIGILGLARSGIATAEKVLRSSRGLIVSELSTEEELLKKGLISIDKLNYLRENCFVEFGGHSDKILECDLVVVSPGISLKSKVIEKLKRKKIKMISEIEIGYLLNNKKSKIIAVTGSNGKSTTVTLIHHLLRKAGYRVILAGNIGSAFTSFEIDKANYDYIVLEVSSFQLDLIETFKPDISVILNITPDHLDRYRSFNDYKCSKFRIFENQGKEDILVYNADDLNLRSIKNMDLKQKCLTFSLSDEKTDVFFKDKYIYINNDRVVDCDYFLLKGKHNISNLLASFSVVSQIIDNKNHIEEFLKDFQPLPHRLEFVRRINRVSFYNDSKATNCDSVIHALQAFNEKINIIMGGIDKGEDFTKLIPYLEDKCENIFLIGNVKEKLYNIFKSSGKLANKNIFIKNCLEDAVKSAYNKTGQGDFMVLLSPACASFDMFKDFEDRGNQFKKIVMGLQDV